MHEVIIIGGGLAGLINACLLSRAGLDVLLIERKTYPFHRVCGEYVSNETLPLLQSIGFDPFEHGAARIHRFRLTAPSGSQLELPLDLGAFGLSRYKFDHELYLLAQQSGTRFLLGEKALRFERVGEHFVVETARNGSLTAKVLIGAHGKRSNLDAFLKRKFFQARSPWVGVKHHLRIDHPRDLIELHNFTDGYCGISRVEDDRVCLCYLVSRAQVRKFGQIEVLEKELLSRNPHLRRIFGEAEFLYDRPEVINEISFESKPLIERGMLMSGDAGGMIAPLAGNGMAMAIHSARILSEEVIRYFRDEQNRKELEKNYRRAWESEFSRRLRIGRYVQRFFGSATVTELFLRGFRAFPEVSRWVVSQTHGKEIPLLPKN